jgi:hypothetical protein
MHIADRETFYDQGIHHSTYTFLFFWLIFYRLVMDSLVMYLRPALLLYVSPYNRIPCIYYRWWGGVSDGAWRALDGESCSSRFISFPLLEFGGPAWEGGWCRLLVGFGQEAEHVGDQVHPRYWSQSNWMHQWWWMLGIVVGWGWKALLAAFLVPDSESEQ